MKQVLICLMLCIFVLTGCKKTDTNNDIGYTFSVLKNSVNVYRGDDIIQTIPCDTEELYRVDDEAPEKFLTVSDWNFDGYDDFFIPDMLLRPNIPGRYFVFDPQNGDFKESDVLNELEVLTEADSDSQTIVRQITSSAIDHEDATYRWDSGDLKLIEKAVEYDAGSDGILIDTFSYDDNGVETLVKREKILLSEENEYLGTETIFEK